MYKSYNPNYLWGATQKDLIPFFKRILVWVTPHLPPTRGYTAPDDLHQRPSRHSFAPLCSPVLSLSKYPRGPTGPAPQTSRSLAKGYKNSASSPLGRVAVGCAVYSVSQCRLYRPSGSPLSPSS